MKSAKVISNAQELVTTGQEPVRNILLGNRTLGAQTWGGPSGATASRVL